jgi:hypothetical protein
VTYPITVLPDDELALIQYLRARTEVTTLVPAERITTQLGPLPTYPVVLVQRIGGAPGDLRWIDMPTLQVDVIGPADRRACKVLALTVRAAIVAIANDTVDEGVLAMGSEVTSPQWLPDTLANPPLPRFTARFRIVLHP